MAIANLSPHDRLCSFCGHRLSSDTGYKANGAIGEKIALGMCLRCFSWLPTEGEVYNAETEVIRQKKFHEQEWGALEDKELLQASEGIKRVISENEIFFGDIGASLICDIGAGRGNFLNALIDLGYNAIGCEPSGVLVEQARSVYGLPAEKLYRGTALEFCDELEKSKTSPGVFVLWHVIEHIPDSLSLLLRLRTIGDNNVTFVFQTPMAVMEYLRGEHLFYPTIETYHFLASELNLNIKFLKSVPYTRFITCVMTNRPVEGRFVAVKQPIADIRDAIGLHVQRLNQCIIELVQVLEKRQQKTKRKMV